MSISPQGGDWATPSIDRPRDPLFNNEVASIQLHGYIIYR